MEVLEKIFLVGRLPGGATLDTCVYAELRKALALSDEQWYLSHYRDKDQVELDFVLENPQRQLIGIGVKAAATVQAQDFKGLRRLKAQTGADFLTGIVLYDGAHALPLGEGLWAIPLGAVECPQGHPGRPCAGGSVGAASWISHFFFMAPSWSLPALYGFQPNPTEDVP